MCTSLANRRIVSIYVVVLVFSVDIVGVVWIGKKPPKLLITINYPSSEKTKKNRKNVLVLAGPTRVERGTKAKQP